MGVPEFIIKKLIVPNSFKTSQNGFSFQILNSFAAATISNFDILVGENCIPKDLVLISTDTQPAISGETIKPENWLVLPVGQLVTINVKSAIGRDPVILKAMTREVGEISVTLNSGRNSTKNRKFQPSQFSFLLPVKTGRLKVYLDNEIGTASPHILGQFVEHLEQCVYDGLWSADGSKIREDTLDLVKQLNPPMIRYPGGNFASGYHWEDGIGPVEKRPARHDAAWQAEESNHVGTDEFLRFCESIGTEPVLVANDGSGTPEEAARWVAYCNSPLDSADGSRRAGNGHPEPYNVKYWGVGNEVWGPWQIGATTAEEYCLRAKRFIKAMKEVDLTIKIVLVGHNPLSDDANDAGYTWNDTVLRELGDEIDYLSWHIYQPDMREWKEVYDPHELYLSVNAAHLDIEKIITRVDKQIQNLSNNRKILQAVDEWNLWLPPMQKNVSVHKVTYTMRDCLYATSVLMTFFRKCQTVGIANIAQLVNVLPLIETNESTAIATAIFYPFILFRQMQPRVVKSEINCESFNSPEQAVNIQAHKNVPYIDGLVTVNDDHTIMTIIVVNRFPFNKAKVDIHFDLDQLKLVPNQSLQIQAASPQSYNSFQKPNQIRISDAKLPIWENSCLQVTLKPCSVYFAELKIVNRQD